VLSRRIKTSPLTDYWDIGITKTIVKHALAYIVELDSSSPACPPKREEPSRSPKGTGGEGLAFKNPNPEAVPYWGRMKIRRAGREKM
jgi:hypothetical protein